MKPLLAATLAVSLGLALGSFLLVMVFHARGRACEEIGQIDHLRAWQRSKMYVRSKVLLISICVLLLLAAVILWHLGLTWLATVIGVAGTVVYVRIVIAVMLEVLELIE